MEPQRVLWIAAFMLMMNTGSISMERITSHPAQVIFQPTGHIHLTQGYIHTTFEIDLTYFQKGCGVIREKIDRQAQHHTDGFFREMQANLNKICAKAFRVSDLYPHHRSERQILALAGALTGTMMGGMALWQVAALADRVKTMENRDKQMMSQVEVISENQRDVLSVLKLESEKQVSLGKDLKLMERRFDRLITDFKNAIDKEHTNEVGLHLTQVLFGFEREVDEFNRGMAHLQANSISTDMISLPEARRAWEAIKEKARILGSRMVFDDAMILFQLPASFVITTDEILTIIIHVPTVLETLTMHSPIMTPVAASKGNNTIILNMEETSDQLAVTTMGDWFTIITIADLKKCVQIQSHNFCPQLKVLRKDFQSTCLGALFKNAREGIAKQCKMEISPEKHYFYSFKDEVFAYSKEAMPFIWSCSNGTRSTGVISGHKVFELSEGCSLVADQFRFVQRGKDVQLNIGTITHRLAKDAFWDHIKVEDFEDIIMATRTSNSTTGRQTNIEQLLHRIHQRRGFNNIRAEYGEHSMRLTGGAIAVITLVTGFFAIFLWRWIHHCRRTNQRQQRAGKQARGRPEETDEIGI